MKLKFPSNEQDLSKTMSASCSTTLECNLIILFLCYLTKYLYCKVSESVNTYLISSSTRAQEVLEVDLYLRDRLLVNSR